MGSERAVTVRILIDPNVRVMGNQTFSVVPEDADGPVATGDQVLAVWEGTGVTAPATVTDVDEDRHLVYLKVNWGAFGAGEAKSN